jgi:hypothetical protein
MMRVGKAVALTLFGVAGLIGAARADTTMIGQTIDASVVFEGQDDNGFFSIPIFSGPIIVGAGQEISEFFSKQLTQGGFATPTNVLSGTATVNAAADSIVVGFSGQAQPGTLNFSFSNLAFAPPSAVDGLSTSTTGIMTGVNMALTPSFTASSVTGMGFFLFGFQPGTNVTQTAGFTLVPVPEPSAYLLMLAGLGVVTAVARRRGA